MKVFEVQFENQKYGDKVEYTVISTNINRAESKASKLLKKYCFETGEGFKNYRVIRVELVNIIDA